MVVKSTPNNTNVPSLYFHLFNINILYISDLVVNSEYIEDIFLLKTLEILSNGISCEGGVER